MVNDATLTLSCLSFLSTQPSDKPEQPVEQSSQLEQGVNSLLPHSLLPMKSGVKVESNLQGLMARGGERMAKTSKDRGHFTCQTVPKRQFEKQT